jgi:hypothetical protein
MYIRVLRTLGIASSLLLAISIPRLQAQNPSDAVRNHQRSTLKGIAGISIAVDPVTPDGRRFGLTEPAIESYVRDRLLDADIRLLSREDGLRDPVRNATLAVTMHVGEAGVKGLYTVMFYLKLFQATYLARDPSIRSIAVTWDVADAGTFPEGTAQQAIRNMGTMANRFVVDYLAANATPSRDNGGR